MSSSEVWVFGPVEQQVVLQCIATGEHRKHWWSMQTGELHCNEPTCCPWNKRKGHWTGKVFRRRLHVWELYAGPGNIRELWFRLR